MTGGAAPTIHQQIEEVKSRVLVSAVIGRDLKLTKQGNEHVGLCPFHNEKTGSFTINDEKAFYHCHGCGAHGDVINYVEKRLSLTFMEALRRLQAEAGIDFGGKRHRALQNPEWDRQREARERAQLDDREKRRRNAEKLWQAAVPIVGTPAQFYLAGEREIDFEVIGRLPRAVRFMHDCWHDDIKRKIPAMVTAIHGIDGRHLATHITYLALIEGKWRKVSGATIRDKIIRGSYGEGHIAVNKGTCRAPLKDIGAGTPVFISEGIEDALTVAMAKPDARVIAAAALGNIGKIGLPAQCGPLTLIGQNDPEGGGADQQFERCIGQLQARGFTVKSMWPRPEFKDFNDQLRDRPMKRAA